MKKIVFGAFALAFAVPAASQTAPATDPHAGHAQHQGAAQQGEQHQDHGKHMEEMQKHCQEMMKHHGKDHGAKSGTTAPADANHEGHKGQ